MSSSPGVPGRILVFARLWFDERTIDRVFEPLVADWQREWNDATPAQRRWVNVKGFSALAVCGVVLGQWVTPVANQSFRNEAMSRMNGRPSVAWKGVRERSTLDLIAGEGSTIPTPARTRELASRATLALLPAVLAWLRWRALGRARNRSWRLLRSCLLAFAACAAIFTVLPVSIALERTLLAPGFGPLLALTLFAITIRTGIWLRQRTA